MNADKNVCVCVHVLCLIESALKTLFSFTYSKLKNKYF